MKKTGVFCSIFLLLISIGCPKLQSQSTALQQVEKFTIVAPQLETKKQIWVYLPSNYENAKSAYEVIYMHDAQNLFDVQTSYAGEWHIDEFLDSIVNPKTIVVGIEHGNEKRLDELTPFPHETYGGGKGDLYLEFIVQTLKPHIDSTFRTQQSPQKTSIIGSSLGGLLSFYALLKYPDVFGKAGVFSPSFWFSDAIYDFAKSAEIPKTHKIYFVVGTDESETAAADQQKMVDLLLDKGMSNTQIKNNIVNGGQHNEAFWAKEFPEAYFWLTN